MQQVIDFRGLKPFAYLSLVPQWDFLDLLTDEGRRYPHFDLRMRHEAIGLIEKEGRVAGVHVRSPEGEVSVQADLIVACDGRHSTLREAADMPRRDYGAPMDVLWFRVPRKHSDPEDTFAIVDSGHMMVLLNRTEYWQAAYVVPKGSDKPLRAQPVETLCDLVAKLAPFLKNSVRALATWDEVKTLVVRVDRLERWYRPGLLLIADAAHASHPSGVSGTIWPFKTPSPLRMLSLRTYGTETRFKKHCCARYRNAVCYRPESSRLCRCKLRIVSFPRPWRDRETHRNFRRFSDGCYGSVPYEISPPV